MYPTRALPFTFAIKRFMRSVNDTPGIGGIRPIPAHWGSVDGFGEYISLQSNVIYLNRSHVTEGNLRYGFVEFPKGSTIRAWFLTKFPGSDTSCTAVPSLQNTSSVCNGTSVCNAFMKDDKGIQLKCDDMQDEVACKELVQQADLTVDNAYGNRNDVGDQQICSSPRFSCISGDTVVPAYRVTRFATVNNSADPINAFLNYSRLWNDWAAMAGTCTNTYKQVYRYKKGNDTHLLEAECTNGTAVCKLTGRYHRLDEIHQSSSNEELMLSRLGERRAFRVLQSEAAGLGPLVSELRESVVLMDACADLRVRFGSVQAGEISE
ncbi:hypothetical protein Mapa_007961 [Marchantia paleacea]|nr:hypothetical protein Mapa_007961 [Marchantia paleacea]